MKLKPTIWLSSLLFSTALCAKVDVSPFFIQISDAMAAIKKGETAEARPFLTALQQDFSQLEQADSEAGQKVRQSIERAVREPDTENLTQLSKDLYLFEKEQNPVDYAAKHKAFTEQMTPLYQKLQQATETQNTDEIKQAARNFGKTWARNERAVREISLPHYGKFERTLGLLRIAVHEEKSDLTKITNLVKELGENLAEFNRFEVK